jgi:hypothetical protein
VAKSNEPPNQRRSLVLTVPFATIRPEGFMTVTHNDKQYHASKLNDNEWQLSSVDKPREKITMNRWQMHIAGLLQ